MELTSLQNGRYKIESILGQGGFGITYRAVQTSLGRTVAIKEFFMKDYCERAEGSTHVTMGTQSSREMVQRYRDKFEKEARTLARLKHPHIIPVIDVFQENNTSYYVMEYAEGASLKQQVDEKGPLSEARAVNYILQVADALRYLHGQHICHLDIKPANILTTAHGEAILADFGLAKQYDEEGGETSTTPIGRSKGYAPPEQYMTEGIKAFSPETDVYAIGATLYFLLTGNTPPESIVLGEQSLNVSHLSPRMGKAVLAAMQSKRTERVTLDKFEALLNEKEEQADSSHDEDVTVIDVMNRDHSTQYKYEKEILSNSKSTISFLGKNKRLIVGISICILIVCIFISINSIDKPLQTIDELTDTSELLSSSNVQTEQIEYEKIYKFFEGMAVVRRNGKYGYINEKREEVIPCQYDDCSSFKYGIGEVKLGEKLGFIDKTGKEIVPLKTYDETYQYGNIIIVGLNSHKGMYDNHGNLIVPIKYEDIDYSSEGYSEGLIAVQQNGKWGFVDKQDNVIIPFKYELAMNFSEGLAGVQFNGKTGFINKKNQIVIDFIYELVLPFKNGEALVRIKPGTAAYIDKEGNILRYV
ncbi:WG repeat-containing protein [Bacteroides caecigallinarum]|uniref:WG repeat-containing protein n=1 Tax=Bacteroides caecigallinarum TaxID=1411144 RepID=UPI001F4424CF|nr:WG repeat-containing protein [Bacteroides caecigallinarum]MCF2580693.1 WG repeat-containing protein [Bacteroides caecigallinarum]